VIPRSGFGFSGRTRERGWDNRRIARAWAELMARLGYDRYGAVGNDAGSMISPELGTHRRRSRRRRARHAAVLFPVRAIPPR
jgi:pimeloyl-ACP methyl ester carboxylesterase